MGRILRRYNKEEAAGQRNNEIWLLCDHLFGRDSRCSTVLRGNAASRFHARISWNGNEWMLRDLGSRNGTYINGRRQENGGIKRIKAGDRILFGDMREEYLVDDEDGPKPLIIRHEGQDGLIPIPITHLLPLPSAEKPLCTIFGNNDGFCMENENGELIPLEHGQDYNIGGIIYHVVLCRNPGEMPQTGGLDMVSPGICGVHLDIAISPDEESAEIVFYSGNETLTLQPRAHFYLLAYLARIRNSQTPMPAKDLSSAGGDEYGWVDCEVVCDDLMINREHLAQQVFRIRQDFKNHNPAIAERIIDRRLRGKMRIGFPAGCFDIRPMI